MIQPFDATNWLDLRVGFWLSITDDSGDDTITGLSETISGEVVTDRYYIGILHLAGRRVFCGYSNGQLDGQSTDSILATSDAGIGTTNANYWRPTTTNNNATLLMRDNGVERAMGSSLNQPHFAQANIGTGGPAGYATMLGMRFTRDNTTSRAKIITMRVKQDAAFNSDILFSSTPTKALLESNLEAFPSTVTTLGPIQLSEVPDALYLYWPFHNSRIRIHATGIVKVA